ncbi:hypothetical protein OIDMADRAFT_156945 [Oidiodendron maius Zn]|uniref:Cell cycle inhibitor Nif1 n=1 Tax=Oidiodendron maius (strain Zn) TaxID=913774 RepID=A0A0C3HNX5_OIDMZ|nr:hypothetical protein OIDMADRAFT_156945 [Oidiodendron maius Zn]
MANRPTFIDVRSQSHHGYRGGNGAPSPRGLPSPRMHLAGEIPPHLSPLDAFAAQSRMLAKQLDEGSTAAGRRLSRLPPLTIENTLQNRPGYFRSLSADPAADSASPRSAGVVTAVEDPALRPKSIYPQVSGTSSISPLPTPRLDALDEEQFRGRRPSSTAAAIDREHRSSRNILPPLQPPSSSDSMYQRRDGSGPRRQQEGSLAAGGYDSRALAPPRSPFAQRTPSPKSMSESSDDDFTGRIPTLFPHRNLSNGSGFSSSPTGISSELDSKGRSPSVSSEISVGGTHLPKPAFNFSRPLSRATQAPAPVDIPTRQASSDSQPSFVLADDTVHTPVSMHGESFPDTINEAGAAPSYVYSTFSLPRGKTLQRNSLIFQEQVQFPWEQPLNFGDSFLGGAPPSPPSRPSTSSKHENTRPSLDPGKQSYPTRPSYELGRRSAEHDKTTPRPSVERPTSASAGSSSTIKARSQNSLLPKAEWSAEEHVGKAIEFHEAGALTKSTYHLRLAARQNHPTGMLLYALACRHGWGMRPNQKEGVAWLRKAADSVSPEMFDEENSKDGVADLLEQKMKKAQFALSIYELGVSHMNGWGIEQDKTLALKCFEIAGSWGDGDALAEAGYCYAQGVGCKKDLKKSAGLYRQAEAKGISMVGNSWIYKAKYNDDTPKEPKKKLAERGRSSTDKESKATRSKSRTRNMFGRMKSNKEPGRDPRPEPLP